MLVVSVGFFVSNSQGLYADTKTKEVSTWNELENALTEAQSHTSDKYEITLKDDLVATKTLNVLGDVVLKGDTTERTIYRHVGETDFSVFNVTSGGKLELVEKVTMTGDTAKVYSDENNTSTSTTGDENIDANNAFEVVWTDGQSNDFTTTGTPMDDYWDYRIENYEVWTTYTDYATDDDYFVEDFTDKSKYVYKPAGTVLDKTLPQSWAPRCDVLAHEMVQI